MRDGFIFYRSFASAIQCLSNDEDRLKMYDAIVAYALDGERSETDGVVSAMMELVIPQIDANNKRYEDGKKGGRPKKPVVSEEKTSGFETENHRFQNEKPKDKLKLKVKPKEKEKPKDKLQLQDKAGGRGGGSDDDDPFDIMQRMTPQDIDSIYSVYPESGGFLIDEVCDQVEKTRTEVKDPVKYILGYARNVKWDDNADHFDY